MRAPLAVCVVLLACPSLASEQSDLIACFQALGPHQPRYRDQRGCGFDVSPFEREASPSERRPTLAVPVKVNEVEGLHFYTEHEVFDLRLPRKFRGGAYRVYPFELTLPERGSFRCVFGATDYGCPSVDCSHEEREYHAAKPKKLKGDSRSRWPLKAAVLERLQKAGSFFAKQMSEYGEALAEHLESEKNPSDWQKLGRAIGWKPSPPPTPPYRGSILRELGPCLDTEDPEVRDQARSLKSFVEKLPEPR